MKLFEFEAKNILKEYGIAIPDGGVARSPEEAAAVAAKVAKPVAVKSQVLVAGRGKAGGIKFADSAAEAKKIAGELLGADIKGSTVKILLIEEKLDIAAQYYASVTIDRQAKSYIVLASTEGGVDIEQVANATPEKIVRYRVDPGTGFNEAAAVKMLDGLKMAQQDAARLGAALNTLYKAALDKDADLVEMNPLVKTADGRFFAADARMITDDNALFRHPELASRSADRVDDTPLEAAARKQGLAYVDLDGYIGIVGNGAGLVMATLDLVSYFGGKAANFLDVGGGGNVDVTKRGILLVMSKPQVRAVFVNILGGITRCDIVAQAVIEALKEAPVKKPIVVRMMGTNEELGNRMLNEVGIKTYPNMEAAIQEIVKLGEK